MGIEDAERTRLMVKNAIGRRLKYRVADKAQQAI
jgi:hypothetical protein